MAGEGAHVHAFVGRGEVVDALQRRFEEVRSSSAAVTVLVGSTGAGKSTLISEFVPELQGRGARVLVGRAPAVDAPPPFSLLRSAIDSARDDPLLRDDADPRMGTDQLLVGFVPGLEDASFRTPGSLEARLLDLLGGGLEGGTAKTREELLTHLSERFLEYTRHGPTVLVLEDLDRADTSSLAAVEFFLQELQDRPLWVLATARPPEALAITGRELLQRFERATGAERLVLRNLTSEEAAEYLHRNIPSQDLSPQEILRRFSETDGSPYILQQLSHPRPSEEEGDEALARRRPSLSPHTQEILDLAAVLGPEVPFSLLLQASGDDEERLAEEVDRLVAQGLLFERPGERLVFVQDRLREEVYNCLSEEYRRLLHRRAGVALEGSGPLDPARIYSLARHFYLAREVEASVRYNRLAAGIAERALAPESAWEHLIRALESCRQRRPEEPDAEAEIVLSLARITEELGVLKEAEEILREFLDRTEGSPRLSPGRRAAVEVFLCRVLAAEGNLPATAELAQKVLSTPGLEDQLLVQVGAHHHLGMVRYYEGRYREALAQHTREIELARRVGNPLVLAHAQVWRVANLQMLGQVEQAIAEAREVTATRDRLGSVRESANAHLVLGDILADARSPPSDRKAALAEYEAAIRFAEQAKDPRRIGWALYKTAELRREERQFDDAREKVERACHILREVGDHVGLAAAIRTRGHIAMDQGALDPAEADLLEAQQLLQGTDNALEEIDTVLRLAQLAALRQDGGSARSYVSELTRMGLPRLRPDLQGELEALQLTLGRTSPE